MFLTVIYISRLSMKLPEMREEGGLWPCRTATRQQSGRDPEWGAQSTTGHGRTQGGESPGEAKLHPKARTGTGAEARTTQASEQAPEDQRTKVPRSSNNSPREASGAQGRGPSTRDPPKPPASNPAPSSGTRAPQDCTPTRAGRHPPATTPAQPPPATKLSHGNRGAIVLA